MFFLHAQAMTRKNNEQKLTVRVAENGAPDNDVSVGIDALNLNG